MAYSTMVSTYLDGPDAHLYQHDEWFPETNLKDWETRGRGLERPWALRVPPDGTGSPLFARLDPSSQIAYAGLLGGDLASVQRDQFLYYNALERLKIDFRDEVADEVVNNLRNMGVISAALPASKGGPPEPASPLPVRSVFNWLCKILAQIARVILRIVATIVSNLRRLGFENVAIDLSIPSGVSVELPVDLFHATDSRWAQLQRFLDQYIEGISNGLS